MGLLCVGNQSMYCSTVRLLKRVEGLSSRVGGPRVTDIGAADAGDGLFGSAPAGAAFRVFAFALRHRWCAPQHLNAPFQSPILALGMKCDVLAGARKCCLSWDAMRSSGVAAATGIVWCSPCQADCGTTFHDVAPTLTSKQCPFTGTVACKNCWGIAGTPSSFH